MFDFAVPSGIQRRFFSFLLRKTLGHFLKPGQLDLHQIDSQLGSGTVQVKDLELDGQVSPLLPFPDAHLTACLKAINQLLVGLPLTLYDGFISGITARIPFPNPLSSTVGCHVQSLNLTFQVTPEQPISPSVPFHNSSNLADSVVSVAETFIHGELTPREEATLRQTLRPSAGSSSLEDESENVPGGFNPFGHSIHAEETRKEPHSDDDPAGVSVFATLIERLLAKFEFSAVDTKITIVYPEQASFTLSVSEITYHTDSGLGSEVNRGLQSTLERNNRRGQLRTVSVSGLKVTSRDLRVIAPSPTVTSTLSPISFTTSRKSFPPQCNPLVGRLSRNSSSSSLDEDTQLMMSQSIAILPPSSPHLSSASNSMYQSAVSTDYPHPPKADITSASLSPLTIVDRIDDAERACPQPRLSIPRHEYVEETLLSFGSQPVVFSLQTPSRPTSGLALPAGSGHPASLEDFVGKPEQETLQLSVTVGTLACAFHSRHLRVLLDIVEACISELPTSSPIPRKQIPSEPPCAAVCLEANVVIRGIVIIALPERATGEFFPLDAFFERPLAPPRLPRTYLRLLLDAPSFSFRLSAPSPDLSMSGAPRTSSAPVYRSTSAKMVISDVSLFTFHGVSSVDDPHIAAPVLITDQYLPMLHVAQHHRPSLASEGPHNINFPVFEVTDWTRAKFEGGSAKLSTWRLRHRAVSGKTDKSHTPSQRPSDLPSPSNPFIPTPLSEVEDKLPVLPAIEISGWLTFLSSKENTPNVDIKIAPLHLFLDLGTIFKENLLVRFVDDITSAGIFAPRKASESTGNQTLCQQVSEKWSNEDVENDVEISLHANEREEERKRLETLVLEGLDLGTNYQRIRASKARSSRQPPALSRRKVGTGVYHLSS